MTQNRNSQGKDRWTFEESRQGKDPSTCDGRSHHVERWRVQEKCKEERSGGRKKKEGETLKKGMVEEVQRGHHLHVSDENEERRIGEGKQNKCKTLQSETNFRGYSGRIG